MEEKYIFDFSNLKLVDYLKINKMKDNLNMFELFEVINKYCDKDLLDAPFDDAETIMESFLLALTKKN